MHLSALISGDISLECDDTWDGLDGHQINTCHALSLMYNNIKALYNLHASGFF